MELTKEQYEIINSTGNIKINAVAGSGKTTTVIEYARTRPSDSKILYLVFNKSVKLEASRKFAENGLANVKVETAHSLAYRYVVFRNHYNIKAQGYKTNEIAELLKLQGNEEKHTEYVIANHISKFIAYFCNSDKEKVQDLNYLDTVSDPKAKTFVSSNYRYIEAKARLLLSKMDKGEIEVTHDFYLKKFQLSNPKLNYDYILFDEGQDASPAMLDVFLKQKASKVIVGDTHQQIYGWRFAVNSLEKADFKTYQLSTSFRFGQDIANLAMAVLKYKEHFGEGKAIPVKGEGKDKQTKTMAIIARTNLGLLLKAIEYITEMKKVKHIYFEGNINSYTYADEGASLYDVLNLYNGRHDSVRDNLIRTMKDLDELEDYIEKTEDVHLSMMVEIVKEYGNKIPEIIRSIKAKHVENDEKDKAEVVFSTVHRCKGMEYDTVQIVDDFVTEEKIEKLKNDKKIDAANLEKLNQEINLLYVALTRTKNSLYIPESLMPRDFPECPDIHVIVDPIEEVVTNAVASRSGRVMSKTEKAYTLEKVRAVHKGAYRPWTAELDSQLTVMYCEGLDLRDMAKRFGRTKSAIASRIRKLELEELYG